MRELDFSAQKAADNDCHLFWRHIFSFANYKYDLPKMAGRNAELRLPWDLFWLLVQIEFTFFFNTFFRRYQSFIVSLRNVFPSEQKYAFWRQSMNAANLESREEKQKWRILNLLFLCLSFWFWKQQWEHRRMDQRCGKIAIRMDREHAVFQTVNVSMEMIRQ